LNNLKQKILAFIDSEHESPILVFITIGITPILFYVANNYWALNSMSHLLFFLACLTVFLVGLYVVYYLCFKTNKKLHKHEGHALFWFLVIGVIFFLTHTYFNSTLKRIFLLLALVVLWKLIPFKPRKLYKKIIVMLLLFSGLSMLRILIHAYEDIKPDTWINQPDDIESVKFKKTPNVYMIQPDGYVSEQMFASSPYSAKSDLFSWLETNGYKVYNGFRSNYPASLTSNASLFAMKQHKFAEMLFPKIEMANGREIISTNNPVVSIFNNNGYQTHFIAEDEYFQQNKKQKIYDHYNIKKSDFPYLTTGGSEVRDVYKDFKKVFKPEDRNPKFFFIEKLLPHHVAFYNTDESIDAERLRYLSRIEEVNVWLKDIVTYISDNDENSIIIILADHGGWVGLRSFNDLFSNEKPELIKSIFSNIAAIKWNGNLSEGYDKDLKSNVNIFRVLFATLSENPKYLDNLEDDSSYNLKLNNLGYKDVIKSIDGKGNVVNILD